MVSLTWLLVVCEKHCLIVIHRDLPKELYKIAYHGKVIGCVWLRYKEIMHAIKFARAGTLQQDYIKNNSFGV